MRNTDKRKAALAGTRNGLKDPSASEGNLLMALYPSVGVSATVLAAAVIARRYRLTPPVARVVVELAGMGGAS